MSRWPRVHLAAVLLALAGAAAPTLARVDVTLDAASLNDLVANMAPDHVAVDLGGGRQVTLRLQDLRITGFDPSAGSQGMVLTKLRLKVPELNLDVPVSPKLSFQFRDAGGKKVAYLRFEEVILMLPLTGSINVAPLIPPLPIVSDQAWIVPSARGKVRVEPHLVDAKLGASALRLGFDLSVGPEAGGTAPAAPGP